MPRPDERLPERGGVGVAERPYERNGGSNGGAGHGNGGAARQPDRSANHDGTQGVAQGVAHDMRRDAAHDADRGVDPPMIPANEVEAILAARVAAEVAKQLATIQEALSGHQPSGPPAFPAAASASSGAGDMTWMEALAQELKRVSDGGMGQKPIPPAEIEKRKRARAEMEALIGRTHQSGQQPTYTLTRGCYLGERFIPQYYIDRATKIPKPTEIGWWGIPNEYMQPTNAEAQAIHGLFLDSIGGTLKRMNVRITPGGLVVRSGGLNPEGGTDLAPRVGRDVYTPTIRGTAAETRAVETRILGTLLEPARQMV